MKAFIIDDEEAPRKLLKFLIKNNFPEIEVTGEASRLKEGLEKIENEEIDILFLDIEMPKHKGLEVLDFINGDIDFEIIFITAYNQYAIDAIKISAFDYLLKPIDLHELKTSIERLKKKRATEIGQSNKALELLKNNLSDARPKVYLLRSHSKEHYIALDDIFYLEADGMYTRIHLEKEVITVSKPLKAVLKELPKQFVRTHRSYAVNAANVVKPLKIKNNLLALKSNCEVPISALKKKILAATLV